MAIYKFGSGKKFFAGIILAVFIIGVLLTNTTEGLTSATDVVASSGVINYVTPLLKLNSSINPARSGILVQIFGIFEAAGNRNYSGLSTNLQYSQDQITWNQIATVAAKSDGTFEINFAFPSSGNFIVKATCGNQVTSYEQTVVDRIVNLNGLEDSIDIQTAINSLPAQGGTVYIRSGLYDLGGRSLQVRSNLALIGDGIDKTIIRLYPTMHTSESMGIEDAITSNTDIDNLVFENFTLIQNGAPMNHHGGIILRGGKNNGITVRNLHITDISGAGIDIPNYNGVLIENCIIERAWTGITVIAGLNAEIRNNIIMNTNGDGIFPQISATNVIIENNYLENIGDTAIDITGPSSAGTPSHMHITITNNKITNGCMRVTNAKDVQITGNIIQYGEINVDAGQGTPSEVRIVGNQIVSKGSAAIGFYGASDSSAENNIIRMEQPSSNTKQSGITAAIWGTGLIAGNTIQNSANYGIDFGGWGLGGSSDITIRGNTIQDYGNFGVYDNNKVISTVRVEGNTITSSKATATYTIFTENPANHWVINGNT